MEAMRNRLEAFRRAPRTAAAVALVSSVLAACGGSGGGGSTPAPSGPSGALGVVTVAAARVAVEGLCAMRTTFANDIEKANGVFYDQTHEELHVIAAATEEKDRTVAARLLQAKEKVEADLTDLQVPDTFVEDVDALLSATQDALRTIGVSVPGCA